MPRPTLIRQRGLNGRFLSSRASVTATGAQHPRGLFALPPEVRLAIYGFLFRTTDKCTLRRLEDIPSQRDRTATRKVKVHNNSILTTCKTFHTEALPLFYASRTFHYTTEHNGLYRQPSILEGCLGWVKHISIDVTVTTHSFTKLDTILATHVQTIIKHCTKLSSFTLHVIPATEPGRPPIFAISLTEVSFGEGAAAKSLRMLRPRVDQLSVVYFGGWHSLHDLRKAIADDGHWVEEGKCYSWPGLSLTEAQDDAVDVKQRRYTMIGSEHLNHPHKQCIRIFRTYRSENERYSRDGGI